MQELWFRNPYGGPATAIAQILKPIEARNTAQRIFGGQRSALTGARELFNTPDLLVSEIATFMAPDITYEVRQVVDSISTAGESRPPRLSKGESGVTRNVHSLPAPHDSITTRMVSHLTVLKLEWGARSFTMALLAKVCTVTAYLRSAFAALKCFPDSNCVTICWTPTLAVEGVLATGWSRIIPLLAAALLVVRDLAHCIVGNFKLTVLPSYESAILVLLLPNLSN